MLQHSTSSAARLTPTLFSLRVTALLDRIKYLDWDFWLASTEPLAAKAPLYLQVRFQAPEGWQHGRKWLLSPHMTDSEIVMTAFKAVMTAAEHEVRENFLYQDKRIFGPHLNVEVLAAVADMTSVRPPQRL